MFPEANRGGRGVHFHLGIMLLMTQSVTIDQQLHHIPAWTTSIVRQPVDLAIYELLQTMHNQIPAGPVIVLITVSDETQQYVAGWKSPRQRFSVAEPV